jgi:hypothetical protein
VPAPKTPVFDDVERYFDRLDAAFATLSKEPSKIESAFEAPVIVERAPEPEREPEPEPEPAPVAATPEPPAPSEKIGIADAFAALLAAEQRDPASAAGPQWLAGPPPAIATDDIVDRVSRRVLEQLSDRVVRETVSQLVSAVAERLVREEIERLKSSIK